MYSSSSSESSNGGSSPRKKRKRSNRDVRNTPSRKGKKSLFCLGNFGILYWIFFALQAPLLLLMVATIRLTLVKNGLLDRLLKKYQDIVLGLIFSRGSSPLPYTTYIF